VVGVGAELEQHLAAAATVARGLGWQEVERQGLVGVGLGLLLAPARLRLPLASHVRQVSEGTTSAGRRETEVGDSSRFSVAASARLAMSASSSPKLHCRLQRVPGEAGWGLEQRCGGCTPVPNTGGKWSGSFTASQSCRRERATSWFGLVQRRKREKGESRDTNFRGRGTLTALPPLASPMRRFPLPAACTAMSRQAALQCG
jgi:hypothetical protein